MYATQSPFQFAFGQQKKEFMLPEEYFSEIQDSDSWQTKLFKILTRLLSNTYSHSAQEMVQEIANVFFNEMCTDTTSYYSSIENSFYELSTYLDIDFPNVDDVVDYSVKYSGFYDVLIYASILTREKFGENSQISVELYRDPEFDDQYISIYVRQDSYDDDILEQIEEVCSEYEEALSDTSGWLLVTTDFKPKSR